MKRALALVAIAIAFFPTLPLAASAAPVLVELYTSQGCSSCPPADKFAGVLAKEKNVIVLTLPVTYWDRLGWKDSLAQPKFTQRQRAYARRRSERNVYTPQMVIDGGEHGVGSSRRVIYRLIKERQKDKNSDNTPTFSLKKNRKGQLVLSVPQKKLKSPLVLWRADFTQKESVAVGAGENSGRTITYHNVARTLTPLRMWKGKNVTQVLTPRAGTDGIVIFFQEKNNGKVVASRLALHSTF